MTIWMMAAVVLLPTVIGLPIVRLLAGSRPLTEEDWCAAPFVGGALLILPLQAAFYDGFPVQSVGRLWIGTLLVLGAAIVLRTRRRGGWSPPPWPILLAALGVFVFHCAGLLRAGASRYLGRAWIDQFNYIGIAEFIARHPFRAPIGSGWPFDEWVGASGAGHRIGQSVLHAAFTTIGPSSAKVWFEPLILWSTFLLPLALFAIARRLGLSRTASVLAAIGGGLLPAVATIHLECYFSHALAVPYVLMTMVLCARMRAEGRLGDAVACALVISAAAAIYFEFLAFMLLMVGWLALATVLTPSGRTRARLTGVLFPLIAPFVLNHTAILISVAFGVGGAALGGLYPWAYSVEGILRLWLGDLVLDPALLASPFVRIAAVTIVAAGFLGWGLRGWRCVSTWNGADDRLVAEAQIMVSSLSLAVLPLLLMVRDTEHGYQVYKLWLSFVPLLAIGVALLLTTLAAWAAARGRLARVSYRAACAAALGVIVFAGAGTADMIAAATSPTADHTVRRQSPVVFTEEFAQVERVLTSTRDQVVTCVSDRTFRGYLNGWVAYFSRDTRAWVLNYYASDRDMRHVAPGGDYLRGFPAALTPDMLVVSTSAGALWSEGAANTVLWRGPTLSYERPGRTPVALACHPEIRRTANGRTADITLHPAVREIVVVSSAATEGTLMLHGANPASSEFLAKATLLANGVAAPLQQKDSGPLVYAFPLRAGLNRLEFRSNPAGPEPDAWPIMVDATLMQLHLGTEWTAIERVENVNTPEVMGGEQGWWLGGPPMRLTLVTGRAGTLALRFQGAPGPSRGDEVRRVRVSTDAGFTRVLTVGRGETQVEIPVTRGRQHVELAAIGPVERPVPNDSRTLLLAVTRLRAELVPASTDTTVVEP